MSNKLITTQNLNLAVNALNLVQSREMNKKLNSLIDVNKKSNSIQKKNVETNKKILSSQKELEKLNTKSLKLQGRQVDAIENQTKMQAFQFEKQNKMKELQIKIQTFEIQRQETESLIKKIKKEKLSNMMEVVFNAPKEIETIMLSNKHNIEKLFQLKSIEVNCKNAGVATDQVDDFSHKKFISDFQEKLKASIKETLKLNSEEKEDLKAILGILSIDEEIKIQEYRKEIEIIEKKLNANESNIKLTESTIESDNKELKTLKSKLKSLQDNVNSEN